MADVEFGLMLRHYDPSLVIQAPNDAVASSFAQGVSKEWLAMSELWAFNLRCIEALAAGFTTLWLEDHLQWQDASSCLECMTTLSYLASQFPRFKVGTLVLSQAYRNPALLAKMAANLQFLSGGRVIVGLGAGWKEDEYRAFGYPFPSLKTRMEQLEEAAQIVKAMWTTQPATVHGQHYAIQDAFCSPRPQPPIPLLIGGGGERRTLELVARYADMWNFNSVSVEEYARKVAVLKQHCERVGRNPEEIALTYLSTLSVSEDESQVVRSASKHFIAGNAAQVTRELEQFRAVGVKHFMFRFLDVATVERFVASVVPNFG